MLLWLETVTRGLASEVKKVRGFTPHLLLVWHQKDCDQGFGKVANGLLLLW